MDDPWRRWVHDVLNAEPDDAFVALLKERLRNGDRLVRVSPESPDFIALPVYVVILARGSELFPLRIPHSRSFTRWSFQNAIRMETPEQESWRFDALVAEALRPLIREWGRDWLQSILVEQLRRYSPPRTLARLSEVQLYPVAEGEAKWRAVQRLDGIFIELARRLGEDLAYEESAVADILDAAIVRSVGRHFSAHPA